MADPEPVSAVPARATSDSTPSGVSSNSSWDELPVAEKMKEWEDLVAGSAETTYSLTVELVRHKKRMATVRICLEGARVVFAFASVVVLVWLAKYFVDHKAPTQGAAIVGAGLAALVTAFLGGKALSQSEQPNDTRA